MSSLLELLAIAKEKSVAVMKLFLSFAPLLGSIAALQPTRLHFSSLHNDQTIREALMRDGILAIQGINVDFYGAQRDCLQSTDTRVSTTLSDGTVRTTVATQTLQGKVIHPLPCPGLAKATKDFREAADVVVDSVAGALDQVAPGFREKTNQAETLEHFHGYTKASPSSSAALDTHTDDGLFLSFVPARWSNGRMDDDNEGLLIRMEDGSLEPLELTEKDSLVIMLGQAVEGLQGDLKAVKHALKIPTRVDTRMWYGRMVIPVNLEDSIERESRQLQNQKEEDCDKGAGEYFCWHKCFAPGIDFNVTAESCGEDLETLACANSCGHVW